MNPSNGGIGGVHTMPGSVQITESPKLGTRASNMQRVVEEMRQHITKLKQELESERAKNRQSHRDKITDIKQVKEACNRDKETALRHLESKLNQEKQNELQKIKDMLNKDREQEIRQILKSKDEEIKQIKQNSSKAKEDAVKVALELQKKAITEQQPGTTGGHTRPASGNSVLVVRLQREIKSLKESKQVIEEQLIVKGEEHFEKEAEMQRMSSEFEAIIAKLNKEKHKAAQKVLTETSQDDVSDTSSAQDKIVTSESGPALVNSTKVDSSQSNLHVQISTEMQEIIDNSENVDLGGTWTIESKSSSPTNSIVKKTSNEEVSCKLYFLHVYILIKSVGVVSACTRTLQYMYSS